MDLSRKEIWNASTCHRSPHVSFLLSRSCLVQAPWDPITTALAFLRSSSFSSSYFCLDHGSPLSLVGFSLLLEVGHSESLPSCARCFNDVLELEVSFGLDQHCRGLPLSS